VQRCMQSGTTLSHASAPGDKVADLQLLLGSLESLKRRLQDVSKQEQEEASRVEARLRHMEALVRPHTSNSVIKWNEARIDTLLVDYLNRAGYLDTAQLIAQEADITQLVDSHVFTDAQEVADALRARNCGPALAWCLANQGRLKKAKSHLEFRLRVQEYLELAKAGRRLEAVQYAQQHLQPFALQNMQELQRAVTVILFVGREAAPPTYQEMLSDSQWDALLDLFFQDLFKLHSMPPCAPLIVHMQAGLSALKTPASYKSDASHADPLSDPAFQTLAKGLPFAKHVHSQLLCSVTHSMMDDNNPPIVLPNGYVYSQKAVEMIKASHEGRMVCPQTGKSFPAEELRRAFVV